MTTKEKTAEVLVTDVATAAAPAADVTTAAAPDPAASDEKTGVRARRAFMLKQFLPEADWIMKNIVAHGKGTKATIGRIYGVATGYENKTNIMPDGSTSVSIMVKGMFQSESYLDGESSEAGNVYFPMAYAEKIAAIFDTQPDVKVIEVDTDIGLEATGKIIPYEWIVTAFIEGEEMAVMRRLRASRRSPAAKQLTSDPQSLLSAPDKAE